MTASSDTHTQRSETALAGPPELSVTFPGIPAAISLVRSVIGDMLAECPRADDVVLVGCEYATNAIRHSPSGLPGGVFTMRMWVRPGRVRLEVIDSGTGDWVVAPARAAGPDAESGRGLVVVAAIADACGNSGCCAWAEVTWPPLPGQDGLVSPRRAPEGQLQFLA